MTHLSRIAGVASVAILGTAAHAQISASAQATPQVLGGAQFRYSMTLNNTGTTTIGTFWFSWIPNYDLMPVSPTNIVSPPGWTASIVTTGFGNGYSIEWLAGPGSLLPAGSNLAGFRFDSTQSPAQFNALSPVFPTTSMSTSFVYIAGAELDPGYRFPVGMLSTVCYANCDQSTSPPVLNVADFSCFLNMFAAGDAYANCDGSTTPPVLNVADFACFLNAFAAGCP